jgi:hypothetical protein
MSSNAYTVNIVNAEELYVAGDKISGFRLGAVKERDSNIGLNTDFPKLQLDISGTGAIRIPAGTTADRSSIKNSLISTGGATDLLGVLRYNKTTSRYEAIYEHESEKDPKWGNFVMEDSSGNVGIGTNNPSYRLDVNGNGRFNGQFKIGNFSVTQPNTDKQVLQITAGVRQISIGGNGNNTYIKAHEPGNYDNNSLLDIIGHTINLFGRDSKGITVKENGNVGIGTSSPRCRLDVSGVGMFKSPGGYNGLIVESDSVAVGINHNHIGMVDSSEIFYIQYPGTGHTILNYQGGNVGIGTDYNPGAKLEVNGNGRFNDGLEVTHVANDNNRKYLHFGKFENFVSNIPYIQGSGTGTGYDMALNPYNGNVGIGTTSPGAKLEVIGTIKCANSSYCSKRDSQHFDTYMSNGSTGSPMFLNWYSKREIYVSEIRFGYTGKNFGGGWYMTDTTWIRNYNNKPVYLNVGSYNSVALEVQGRVLIGSGTPKFPLHIKSYQNISYYDYGGTGQFHGNYITSIGSSGWGSTSKYYNGNGDRYVSLKTDYGIWNSGDYFHSSDERIKTNIQDVSDNVALQQLRDISCCFYEYKDKVIKGTEKTIGFIAQQVREHMPMAVSIQKGIIPNEMRKIENPQWTTLTDASGNNTYKLTIPDLEYAIGNTSKTTIYKFYVSNDPLGNDECEKEITSLENDPKSFIFQEQWQNVFLYGKEIDDFHTLDKQKLFALNFSASQEIDRIQQQEKTKLEEQTSKLEEQTTKLEEQTTEIISLKNKIITLETQYNNLQQQVQTLIDNQ